MNKYLTKFNEIIKSLHDKDFVGYAILQKCIIADEMECMFYSFPLTEEQEEHIINIIYEETTGKDITYSKGTNAVGRILFNFENYEDFINYYNNNYDTFKEDFVNYID